MRKGWLLLLTVICLFALVGAGCGQKAVDSEQPEDTSWQNIQEKGEFVLGLDDNYPPMGFRDEKGEIVGFDIDMAKEAAKRMGVEVVLKPVEWDGVLLSLKNGDIDVIWNGLTVTPERAQEIAFTKEYMDDRNIIIVLKDSPIKTKKDLAGKIIGLQLGSSSETAVTGDKETAATLKEIRQFSTNPEAMMDLEAGRIDAVVVDELTGRYFLSKRPDKFYVLEGSEDFGRESFAVGLRQEDKAFLDILNKTLDEMKADGTAGEISQKWFAADIVK